MKKIITIVFVLLLALKLFSQPTSNPITDYYGNEGSPIWTDNIKWNTVINMASYLNGANDFQKFENARDELYNLGGGVLYYPSGTYDFKDIPWKNVDGTPKLQGRGLMLKKGVVIRGEAPTSSKDAVIGKNPDINIGGTNDQHGLNALTTNFKFPYRQKLDIDGKPRKVPTPWNIIGIMPDSANNEKLSDVHNVGIAWVAVDGAVIYFGLDVNKWGNTWYTAIGWRSTKVKTYWRNRKPDGTHFMDPFVGFQINATKYIKTKNRLVFGCRLDNSTCMEEYLNLNEGGIIYNPDGDTNWYASYRFAGRISVYGGNLLVANNVISKPTNSFKYERYLLNGDGKTNPHKQKVLFDYANGIGIDVNKSQSSINSNGSNLDSGNRYEPNVVIKDNWVYNHGNKGFDVSGLWLVLKNNRDYRDRHVDWDSTTTPSAEMDAYGFESQYIRKGWNISHEGFREVRANDDEMTRGYDCAGWNVWIDNNWVQKTHCFARLAPVNDGEGILCQRVTKVETFSWAWTNNVSYACPTNLGFMLAYDVHSLGSLWAWNISDNGAIGYEKSQQNAISDFSVIENYDLSDNIKIQPVYSTNLNLTDQMVDCPVNSPGAPDSVLVKVTSEYTEISWKDTSINEIGFRVDRLTTGDTGWLTIAYRPRNAKNEPAFPTATGSIFRYNDGFDNGVRDMNEQKWRDYLAPRNKSLQYRVVSLKCRGGISGDENGGVTVSSPNIFVSEKPLTDVALESFIVYPNPVKDIINIELTNDITGSLQIRIVDFSGKQILFETSQKMGVYFTSSINLSGFNKGIYLIQLVQQGKIVTKTIIKD